MSHSLFHCNRLTILHAPPKFADCLANIGFSKHEEMLVIDEHKVAYFTFTPSVARRFHVPLNFNNVFSEDESRCKKSIHNTIGDRDVVLVPSRVAN